MWLNLEDIISEINQSQKDFSRVVKFIEAETRMVAATGEGRGGESAEFMFNGYGILILKYEKHSEDVAG